MIKGEASQTLAAQIPPERHRRKRRNTLLGFMLIVFGASMVWGSFWLIAVATAFDKWLLAPMAGGFVLALLGAHIMSGELVSAALIDIKNTVLPFKKP